MSAENCDEDMVFAVPQAPVINQHNEKGLTGEQQFDNSFLRNNVGDDALQALTEDAIQGMMQQAQGVFSKWIQTFGESESFEQFCPTRLDEVIKEANALELRLLDQKKQLKDRLSMLSQTLASPDMQQAME